MSYLSKYLVKRKRDGNYSVRIQYPEQWRGAFGGKTSMEKSLKTSDPKVAELRAAPYVVQWKEWLYTQEVMNGLRAGSVSLAPMMKPGSTQLVDAVEGAVRLFARPDGKTILMTDAGTGDRLNEFDNKTTPSYEIRLNDEEDREMQQLYSVVPDVHGKTWDKPVDPQAPSERDREIIDLWLKTQQSQDVRREAERVYRELRELFPGVTLETATYQHAIALAEFYRDKRGNLAISAMKKVRWLSTIMKHAKKMGVITNAFEGVEIIDLPGADGTRRRSMKIIPLDDDEAECFMRHTKNMKTTPHNLQLLAIIVACTGMRPVEACSIEAERRVKGNDGKVYRCVDIACGKGDSSIRTVPLPDCVLPFVPAKIDGPLFNGAPIHNPDKFRRYMVHRSNDMMSYIRALGINAPNKRFYSLRHKAISALTAAECPVDIALEIVGHDEAFGVHRQYIFGQSVYPPDKLARRMQAIWKPFEAILTAIATTPA